MRTRTVLAAPLALLVILAAGACSDTPTQDEIASDCVTALDERTKGDTSKPSACEGLTEENWLSVRAAHALKDVNSDLGLIDENLDEMRDGLDELREGN
ncbi:hypothetical protein ACFWPV_09890 [Streptomyces uncialis]|uniref:hypothetical protein n=1 Tax=Streptomyces uncialis TaxID=1048205 RepID=UPI0036617C0F